jgi:hypothetical protein
MTELQLTTIRVISGLAALLLLTLIAITLDLSLDFLGLRFHMASLGIILGAYFLRPLDNKILNLLLTKLNR